MGAKLFTVVFSPPPSSYSRDPNLRWVTTSENETIPAFYIFKEDAHFTLLYSHGNAEDLGLIVSYLRDISFKTNTNVFAYEYPGYGMASGQPTEESVYRAVEAAFQYVRDVIGTPWDQIVAYGRSIGTGPTCHLSHRTAVRGIILQSPMVSIYRVIFKFRFTLPGDLFVNINKINNICCPVLVIHGTRDEIVPAWHGQRMHDACRKRGIARGGLWLLGGDHNNLEVEFGGKFFAGLIQYLQHLERSPIQEMLLNQAKQNPF